MCVTKNYFFISQTKHVVGTQKNCLNEKGELSGRMLDSRPRGSGFEPNRRHCLVSLGKNINPSLVLVQLRKTGPFITERLLMGRKESNKQINETVLLSTQNTCLN